MWLLIIYIAFVIIGDVIAAGIGMMVELQTTSAISLIVFLALFFSNFAISWFATIKIVDRLVPSTKVAPAGRSA